MHNYYSVFDVDLQRVGFGVSTLSPIDINLLPIDFTASKASNAIVLVNETSNNEGKQRDLMIMIMILFAMSCWIISKMKSLKKEI